MRVADFDFDLPSDLIAQFPPAVRGGSRLLHVEASGALHDRWFSELPALLHPNDLLVLEADPFECPPEQLSRLAPAATMVGGEWVFQA